MKRFIAAKAPRVRAIGIGLALFAMGAICTTASAAQYVPDPTWIGGLMGADNFAGGYDYRRGQKITEGDNGDVIVAGIVPGVGPAAGHTKMGLVRYNRAGVRQTWSNPGANGSFNNQYVTAPCVKTTFCGDDKDVKSIYRFSSRIFVLVDAEGQVNVANPGIPPLYWPGPTTIVYVLGIDGSLLSATTVDWGFYPTDHSRTVYGGGIVVYEDNSTIFPTPTSLAYAGTYIGNGYAGTYARYKVESNGTLTSVVPVRDVALGAYCSSTTLCQLLDIAVGGRPNASSPPRVYVSGSTWHGDPAPGTIGYPAGWDAFVARVDSNGDPVTSFGTGGAVHTEAVGIESGGQKIAVNGSTFSSDEIYVLADVKLACKNGIAVLKFDNVGASVGTFGIGGKVMYGGSNETNTFTCNNGSAFGSLRTDVPTDLVYTNGLLGVSGYNVYRNGACIIGQPCPEDQVDGEVAVIDANTGAISSFRGYAYSDTVGGARTRHSGFWGISSAGDGTFSVAGDARYFETAPADRRGTTMFATLRVAPLGDVIFKNGFE